MEELVVGLYISKPYISLPSLRGRGWGWGFHSLMKRGWG